MLKIGVFDSGLGGLTVVQSLQKVIKGAELFYVADTANAPYGEKTKEQILQYSLDITEHFIVKYQIDALVIACNTATSAAINTLRQRYPKLIIVGTEPAVKPAIEQTKTGKIGILATPATLKGDKYQALLEKLSTSSDVELFEQACPGLVEHIENDTLESVQSLKMLESWLSPMREAGVDTIVLGCTHYPLAKNLIKEVMQKELNLIHTGHAIAQRLLSLSVENGHANDGELLVYISSTGVLNMHIVDNILKSYIHV